MVFIRSYTNIPGEVKDPWYYGNFDETYAEIYQGRLGILQALGYLRYRYCR